jgi:hypothetical protein
MFYAIAVGISVGSIITITCAFLVWAILDLGVKADIATTLRKRYSLAPHKEIENTIFGSKRNK